MGKSPQVESDDPWRHFSVSANLISMHRGNPQLDYKDEVYGDFDFWIGLAGHGIVHFGEQSVDFGAGMVVMAMPGVPIRLSLDQRKPIEHAFVHFDCFIRGVRLENALPHVNLNRLALAWPGLPPLAIVGRVDTMRLAQRFMAARLLLRDDVTRLGVNLLILEVLQRLRLTHARPREANSPEPSRVDRAIAFMQRHIDRPLRMDEIAEYVDVSLPTLRRMFVRQLRMSPGRYLNYIRMVRARDLLRGADFSIGEVAEACGFNSIAFFSRAFKAEHGLAPREFRHRQRASA